MEFVKCLKWKDGGCVLIVFARVVQFSSAGSHGLVVHTATSSVALDVFFFQAEDGIRDIAVTGVQTCALPISVDVAVFEREVLLLGDRLGHAQLVPPRGSGRAGAFVYHARRFVEGTTLRDWLANHGEMPLRRVIEVLRDVLLALAHAHRGSIAHGDLRPENVLLTAGRVQVADTGIVDAVGRAVPSALAGGVGATLCAPAYLAPERRKNGGAGGPRDDMFAVGVLLHEMLTGELPAVEGESLEEVRSLPPWLAELARRCLTPEPTARWPDAAAALDAVGRSGAGPM